MRAAEEMTRVLLGAALGALALCGAGLAQPKKDPGEIRGLKLGQIAAEMEPMYEKVARVITPLEWPHYAPLIKALYDGSPEADIVTEVTFEDGRKGMMSARLKIKDIKSAPAGRNLERAA